MNPIEPSAKIVTQIPVPRIWNPEGPIDARRVRLLNREAVRQLIQGGAAQFVVADVGSPLHWIPAESRYIAWKEDIKPHLVDEPDRPFSIYSYPHGYAYVTSEWQAGEALSPIIVLLEKYH